MTVVHPISRAWITTGGTGAQNYDEFADDAEITAIIEANPHSALAAGGYTPAERVVVLYRITAAGEPPAYGLWCMADTDQISTSADEPGLVIRNEDVFIAKVRERVALAETLQTLLSPALLLQTARGHDLHAA